MGRQPLHLRVGRAREREQQLQPVELHDLHLSIGCASPSASTGPQRLAHTRNARLTASLASFSATSRCSAVSADLAYAIRRWRLTRSASVNASSAPRHQCRPRGRRKYTAARLHARTVVLERELVLAALGARVAHARSLPWR